MKDCCVQRLKVRQTREDCPLVSKGSERSPTAVECRLSACCWTARL